MNVIVECAQTACEITQSKGTSEIASLVSNALVGLIGVLVGGFISWLTARGAEKQNDRRQWSTTLYETYTDVMFHSEKIRSITLVKEKDREKWIEYVGGLRESQNVIRRRLIFVQAIASKEYNESLKNLVDACQNKISIVSRTNFDQTERNDANEIIAELQKEFFDQTQQRINELGYKERMKTKKRRAFKEIVLNRTKWMRKKKSTHI